MEHRCEHRVPMDLAAQVYKHGSRVALGRIKNGGHHGLFLETDYRDVRDFQQLELEVSIEQDHRRKRYCLKTVVVRKSQFGLGLELEVLSEAGARDILDLVTNSNIHPVSREMNQNVTRLHAHR